MDVYAQIRDRYYHLLFRLIHVRELQHWVNNRVKVTPDPPQWMLGVLQARDRSGVLAVLGAELGPYVPMNYYSLLNSLLFRFKAGQTDLEGLHLRLGRMIEYDPDDNLSLLNLYLEVVYAREAIFDGICSEHDAREAVIEAFERCEMDVLGAAAEE